MPKPRVLVICQYYLPGFGGGGGMWTIRNLIERLSDRYEFFVLTTDLDGPARRLPDSVVRDRWTEHGSARVFYATRGFVSARTLHTLIEEAAPSVVYLNSVFAGLTRKYLSARRRGSVKRIPTLISPCGELSSGALRSKSTKKRSFLAMAKLLGLFNGIVWRATTELEIPEIRQAIGDGSKICVAPDLPPKEIIPEFSFEDKPPKRPGKVRMIFASRIAPKKNLHFLLEQISRIPLLECELVIAGPVEERKYWRDCKKEIERLSSNTKVTICGGVSNSELLELLIGSHFFVLPTLNENFGYVFLEALAAGCPLIISENTIWSEAAERNAGFVIPLADVKAWQGVLLSVADMNQDEFTGMSLAARNMATEWLARPDDELAMVEALEYVISEDRGLAR